MERTHEQYQVTFYPRHSCQGFVLGTSSMRGDSFFLRGEQKNERYHMSGFNKIVPEIVQSSIWNEPSDIRIVWITLIAVKDENGYVRGDSRTISRLANVSLEATETALDLFQKPDVNSNTPDNDGRRIEKHNGGWIVLNHHLYRTGDRNEYMREYMKNRRKSKNVNSVNVNITQRSASVSASDSASGIEGGCKGETDFDKFWKEYPRKVQKQHALKAWNKSKHPTIDSVIEKLKLLKSSPQWTKDGGQFIPHPATWINGGGWDDEVQPVIEKPRNFI